MFNAHLVFATMSKRFCFSKFSWPRHYINSLPTNQDFDDSNFVD